MSDLVLASLAFVVLCFSAWVGRALHAGLPEHHRSEDSIGFVRVAASLIVTFTALVLGLLLTTVNADFERTGADLRGYGAMIILLDQELDGLPAVARPVRSLLRAYTASVIASTWSEEAPPTGKYPDATPHGPDFDSDALGEILNEVETTIRRVVPGDSAAEKVQATCLARVGALLDQRWRLVGEAHSAITPSFFGMMALWLCLVFVSFGLIAPRNGTAAACIAVVALSLAGAIFTITELDGPLDGLVKVSSEPMRHALRHLDRSLAG